MINFNKTKNVLVLAPHTDDGELGAGGTISKLNEMRIKVTYVAFSTAKQSVPKRYKTNILKDEVKDATIALGIKPSNLILFDYEVRKLGYHRQSILEDLISLKKQNSFDLIFVPSTNDIHQDHSTVAQEAIRAFKNKTILGYELIWNNINFNTVCFIKLKKKHIDNKIKSLSKYKSQSHRPYMNKEFIKSHAITRGVQIGCDFAESFEVIRMVL
jgi:LmbE family N-acetylglucosaminyl deacetylase